MSERFSVLDHNYMNTGGHIMVSVFTVYDREVKALRYVVANDEGFNWQTMDSVSEGPPSDVSWDEIILNSWSWDVLKWSTYEKDTRFTIEEFYLYKHCQFEFYKKYCKTFNSKVELTMDDLPDEILDELSSEAIGEHKRNEWSIMTDGSHVELNPLYLDEQHKRLEEQLQRIKDFKQYLDNLVYDGLSHDAMERHYDKSFTIAFDGRCVELPFAAEPYNRITDLLQCIIDEW